MKTETSKLEEMLGQRGRLRALARDLVRNEADADDVVQEAYLAALERGEEARNPETWLRRVLRNAALDRMRRDRNRPRVEGARARVDSTEPELADERTRLYRLMFEELEALPNPSRRALVMSYLEAMSAKQIARRLELTPAAVRQRVARATKELRARIEARERGGMRAFSLAFLAGSADAAARTGATSTLSSFATLKATGTLVAGLAVVTLTILATSTWDAADEATSLDSFGDETAVLPPRRGGDHGTLPAAGPAAEDELLDSPTADASASPAATDEALRLGGVVVTAAGAPVQYARVRAVLTGGHLRQNIVNTDMSGRFSFLLHDDVTARGELVLHAERPGLGTATATIFAVTDEPRMVLRGEGRFDGIVVDAEGAPEPRFTLAVLPESLAGDAGATFDGNRFTTTGSPGSLEQRIRTDSEGRFSIRGLRPGRYFFISKESFASLMGERALRTTGDAGVRLVTDRRSVVVRVVDPDGTPIEGVSVSMLARPPRHPELDPGFDLRAITDRDGLVIASFPASSTIGVAVHADDFRLHEERIVLGAGELRRVIRVTRPHQRETGTLVIETDRALGSGVRVDLLSVINDLIISERFGVPARWDGLAPGRYRVRIYPDGPDAQLHRFDLDVEVAAGRESRRRVELPHSTGVRVRPPQGVAAGDLRFHTAPAGTGPWARVRTGVTEGELRTTDPMAPGRYEIQIELAGEVLLRRTVDLPAGEPLLLDLSRR